MGVTLGDPATPACNDGDWDTIPDYAEAYIVGTNPTFETTDRDKFDDGQELFGVTYCPGGDTSCGYGNYPRIEYWNYIKSDMPTWVKPPGGNPFVAAFPIPEVSVVSNSWQVERVTTVTTEEGEMVRETVNYATSVTEGQSTSIANAETWNEWEEVSEAVERPLNGSSQLASRPYSTEDCPKSNPRCRFWGGVKIVGGVTATAAGCLNPAVTVTFGVTCVAGITTGAALIHDGLQEIKSDNAQEQLQPQTYTPAGPMCEAGNQSENNCGSSKPEDNAPVVANQNINLQGVTQSLDSIQYAIDQQGELIAQGLQDVSYAISQPRLTETRTNGRSWGGSQTTTHEEYEEHTVTNGEAFTTGENWSTAWATDSSHAANLTFDFTIENTGTEYARELRGIIFNIYLGDDTEPLVSYPAWEKFPDGHVDNIFPGDSFTFSSDPIPLTLEQMKRIDMGERLTVVLEDFSYGADELFYEDAVSGGLTVYIEDGVEDGDEDVDNYIIPTWGNESVQDVLIRYFPAEVDGEGNINALWTPEFNGTNPPTWNEHYLSNIAWWNIYLSQPDAGNTPLHELPAQAGDALLFRFNRDSDRDGYQDRVEFRYNTDKDDPASHPQPELMAGYVSSRDGDEATVLLKLANSGSFDAYGIDAVMYAPDDTVTIGNNTVGGNGRVRPGEQVTVGSLVQPPDLSNWNDSTAQPYAIGEFTGASDTIITFTVDTAGTVGQGLTAMRWSGDNGITGTLDLGDSYHPPLPVDVIDGVQVGFDTGSLDNGSSFSVTALTPRDTFTYTVNSEPYTPPVIVVSYSDPQGSHRFVTPVELSAITEDLAPYSGQMLADARLDIVTPGVVNPTDVNTTTFTINSPHPEPIENGHLYLNFVADGELVAELPYTDTLQPGPNVLTSTWSTSQFSQTYDVAADNILIAYWTDAQDNIIDSAARPLRTFQEDPKANFETDEVSLTWDFGTARQGTLMQRRFPLASVGFRDLLTYIGDAPGITLEGPANAPVAPADMGVYTMTLNTEYLPTGTFSETIPVRTSDPQNPMRTVAIQGEILPFTPDDTQSATIRPLDWPVTISGTHSQGDWVTYTHTLGPNPQTLQPLKVFSQDYTELLGIGKQATALVSGMASHDIFGDGSDGDLTITSGQTFYTDEVRSALTSTAAAEQANLTLANIDGFAVGDEVLIIQMKGDGAGSYEYHTITNIVGDLVTLDQNLATAYTVDGNARAQILRVPQYQDLTIESGGKLTAHNWDGNTGGVVAFRVSGTNLIDGSIDVVDKGFRGGTQGTYGQNGDFGQQGESYDGSQILCRLYNYGGGGGGKDRNGGGGSYGSHGQGDAGGSCNISDGPGEGNHGATYGNSDLSLIYLRGVHNGNLT